MTTISVTPMTYRLTTAFCALKALYRLPSEKLDAFLKSYEMFDKDGVGDNEEKNIMNYYGVLNHLCAVGEVEKMYIPPTIDTKAGVTANQLLFEQKMVKDLKVKKGSKVLDVGCGRGRVAANMATTTGAKVTGINIDPVQIESALKYSEHNNLTKQCTFVRGNFNDPLPFADNTFDALYQIQVLTYAKDKEKLFAEMFRVMKPGARLSFLDWVKLDKYNPKNPQHLSLMNRVKPLIGAVDTPSAGELKTALEKVGFKVLVSKDASLGGHQADLIEKADKFYKRVQKLVHLLVKVRILPKHFAILFDRLTKDGDAFIEADRLGIITTSHQTIAQKPALSK